MSSKKTRDSSKSKVSNSEASREERHRRSSKDYRSKANDDAEPSERQYEKFESSRSKVKHSSKMTTSNDDAAALAEEEEERRRRKKQLRKQQEEEEERQRREQEEYEDERRRRKEREKKKELENGEKKKHKSSRVVSPPLTPSPREETVSSSKHKSKHVEKDDNYSDDFEQNYDDDFDDEPPPLQSKKKSSSNAREEKSRSNYDNRPAPSSKAHSSSVGADESQVYGSSGRFQSDETADRIRRRYKDLRRLIMLDRQSFNIFEMAPMPARAMYLRDIRLANKKDSNNNANQLDDDQGVGLTSNVKTQTNDDAENVPSQTDEIDVRSMWTQHPSETQTGACGSGNMSESVELADAKKQRENEESLRLLRLETDLGRYQTFVVNAGALMLALLGEQQSSSVKSKSKLTKEKDELDGMQNQSDLNIFSGMTILAGIPLQKDVSIAAACFFEDKPEQVAFFHCLTHTTSYGAIYNVRNPEKMLRLLSCEAFITCCSSSGAYLFAGCQDGSVVLFDTNEPNRYKPDSEDLLACTPTFSTANILFNDRHYNEVIRVLPLRATNSKKGDQSVGSFSLASLDRDGVIIIWSVVELSQSDEAGSIADLGLKPGGKVRMIQSSSMQIKQPIHMLRGSIQAYDVSCPSNDIDHLYVASNASAVYHMTRYGEMGSPGKLRISLNFESQIEVTCLAFNPMVSKLLLVGTGHGQLNLFTTTRDEPILAWPQAFRSTSTVLSCSWSIGRPSVFFAHDSYGFIKYWDLSKELYQPIGQVKIDNLNHFILSTSDQYETAFALIVRLNSSKVEIHQLKRTYATHSDSFMDNFKTILKDIMTNA